MQIHDKIRKLRELRGKSQLEAADALGLSQPNYSKYESGKNDFTVKQIEKLADLLGLSLEDIIGFNEHLIFNMSKNRKANGLVINNHISKNEKKLYEDYIASLKAEIESLKNIIEKILTKK